MSIARTSPLAGVPDRYDGLAGVAALLVLAYAFLVVVQPILGVVVAVALLSVYAVARTGDIEHTAVVAGLWTVVLAAFRFIGSFLGVGAAAILAVVCYGRWQGAW